MGILKENGSSIRPAVRNMRDSERPIDNLEGYEEYISEFVGKRKLRMTDTRQLRRTEDHSNRLKKVLAKRKDFLRYRIDDRKISISSACDSQFVNNTHFFYGDGSRLGHNRREKHYAFDFPMNTRLNKSDFTRHLQKLPVRYTNVTNEWLESTKKLLKPGSRRRSRSAPNVRLSINKEYDRFDKGYPAWQKNSFVLYNVDKNFQLPKNLNLRTAYGFFSKSMTLTMSALVENIDPIGLKPGWQPISSILFSTIDKHFYAIIQPPSDTLKDFSNYWERRVSMWEYKPQDKRETWKNKNVILHLEEFDSEGTRFRRARHVFTRNNEDWFIELDTGKLRMIENVGFNDVMRLPASQCIRSSVIIECRFRNMNMTQEEVTREINKIRADGKLYIVDFDRTSKRIPYKKLFPSSQYNRPRPTIKTAIIEPVVSPQKPLMTTAFCQSSNCVGCYSWRAFKKEIKKPKKKVVFECDLKNDVFEWSD